MAQLGTRVLEQQYPEVTPSGAPGNDYENIPSSPAMFGGLIAQGEERLGQGAEAVGQAGFQLQNFYNQTSADAQTNAFNQRQLNRFYGDPNDPSKPGLFALKGSDAVRMGPQVLAENSQDREALGASLNPVARLQYEEYTRRSALMMAEAAGSHISKQYDVYAQSQQVDKENLALQSAGRNWNDDAAYNLAAHDGATAVANRVRITKGSMADVQSEVDAFHSKLVAARTLGMMNFEPIKAQDFLDDQFQDGNVDSQTYDVLTKRLTQQKGDQGAQLAWDKARNASPTELAQAHPMNPANMVVYGDSLGQGVQQAYKLPGTSVKSAPPQTVLANIQREPDGSLSGKSVILSTGTSNAVQSVGTADDQIKALVAKGARASDITVLGVGDRPDLKPANDRLKQIAEANGAKFQPIDPATLSADRVHPESYSGILGGQVSRVAPTGPITVDRMANAIHGNESGGARTSITSVDNAQGGWQITPGTFAKYAKPGEQIDNPDDNERVGRRIIEDYASRPGWDPQRVAVGYFSGEGNVAPPGSPTPWKNNAADGNGTRVSAYVANFMRRLGMPYTPGPISAPIGHDMFGPAGPQPIVEGAEAFPPQTEIPLPSETPAAAAEAEAKSSPGAEGTQPPAPTPVSFQPGAQPAQAETAPPQQMSGVEAADAMRALAILNLHKMGLSDEATRVGEERINQQYASARIAAEMDVKAKKDRADAAGDEITKKVLSGNPGPHILDEIAADPRLDGNPEARQHLAEFVTRWTGKEPTARFGPAWEQTRKDMLSSPGDPGHIDNFQEVYRRSLDGSITPAGVSDLYQMKQRSARDIDTHSYDVIVSGMLSGLKKKLSFEGESAGPGFEGLKDPQGEQAYANVALPLFMERYSVLLNQAKETGDVKPLDEFLSEKSINQFADKIRPRRELEMDKIRSGALSAFTPDEAPGVRIPPPPEGLPVDEKGWNTVIQKPPLQGGVPMRHDVWANVVETLARNPTPAVVASFDKYMGPSGVHAADILGQLKGEAPRAPAAPTAAPPITEPERLESVGGP